MKNLKYIIGVILAACMAAFLAIYADSTIQQKIEPIEYSIQVEDTVEDGANFQDGVYIWTGGLVWENDTSIGIVVVTNKNIIGYRLTTYCSKYHIMSCVRGDSAFIDSTICIEYDKVKSEIRKAKSAKEHKRHSKKVAKSLMKRKCK